MNKNGKQLPVFGSGGNDGSSRLMTPLQAEILEDGMLPDPDALGGVLSRPNIALGAGYDVDGPEPRGGPRDRAGERRWIGEPPVFQWEIDPADASLESGETSVSHGEWELGIWWQRHPAGLIYVAMQAMHGDDAEGAERAHPIGRNVAVNLVYDERREGVVAIYGTAGDFRPFVEAFRAAVLLPRDTEETNS